MRLFRLFFVLSVIIAIPVIAQNKITLDEAINMAYQKNIDLQKQFVAIKNAETDLGGSARLPNPLFSYSREDLKSNFSNYNEWIASGSIPINFLWERWSNIDSKEKSLEAQKFLYENFKRNITLKVRENYYAFHNHSALSQSLDKTLLRLSNLTEAGKHRLVEGDISEYELQRILIELNKLRATASKIELQKIKFENGLKLLIGFDTNIRIHTLSPSLKKEVEFTERELIKIALDNRNDVKAFQLIIESENLNLSFNKLKIIPEINFTAGYKKQTGDLSGSVLQLDFEIPLFNRNQTLIEQSEIQLSILEKEMLFLEEKIKMEVVESFHNYNVNKNLFEDINDLQFKNIFTTAAFSYEQGEISLVEFIDGINAFIDVLILRNELQINYNNSFFKLEKAVGGSLTPNLIGNENNLGAKEIK
ncbi:MAG: TolC family protein [Melioribacteraceae bacterium]|nr:TolC family protein [Melioribacteraceae bacterium]